MAIPMRPSSPKLRRDLALCVPVRGRAALSFIAVVAMMLGLVGLASGAMHSTSLAKGLCETSGGGRFVKLAEFPGERVDRRLLDDIRVLEKRYKIFVTDGYSLDPVHASNGEHPVGLALDIVPNKAAGGTWNGIDRLAAWAEPKQNQPIAPFRWVGYDGDAGHGRGHHLHLSWNHSEATKGPGRPVRTVYTMRCPSASSVPVPVTPPPTTTPDPTPTEPPAPVPDPNDGGVESGPRVPTGGVGKATVDPAPPVVETGGVDLAD